MALLNRRAVLRARLYGRRDGFWDRQLRARLGADLRLLVQNSLDEPAPEHFTRALRQMEEAAQKERSPHD